MENTLPHWLTLTGQSGSGKGTVAEILKNDFCFPNNIPLLHLNTGDVIAKRGNSESYLAQKVKESYTQAKLQPNIIVCSFYFMEIWEKLEKGQHLIQEGVPRQPGQFALMKQLLDFGIIDSLHILEVKAPEKLCEQRLAERTKLDKRVDLSMQNKPGTSDYVKIATKMAWWSTERDEIIGEIIQSPKIRYSSVENLGSIPDLKKQLQELFF